MKRIQSHKIVWVAETHILVLNTKISVQRASAMKAEEVAYNSGSTSPNGLM